MASYGFIQDAAAIISGILEASLAFQYRLPEVFAGYERKHTCYPVQCPTACLPQAWAAGAPMLGIRTWMGLEPKGEEFTFISDGDLPSWMGMITLEDIPGRCSQASRPIVDWAAGLVSVQAALPALPRRPA